MTELSDEQLEAMYQNWIRTGGEFEDKPSMSFGGFVAGIVACAIGTAIWFILIWGGIEGWKHVGR
jgi:hypothetical protein